MPRIQLTQLFLRNIRFSLLGLRPRLLIAHLLPLPLFRHCALKSILVELQILIAFFTLRNPRLAPLPLLLFAFTLLCLRTGSLLRLGRSGTPPVRLGLFVDPSLVPGGLKQSSDRRRCIGLLACLAGTVRVVREGVATGVAPGGVGAVIEGAPDGFVVVWMD